MILPKMKEVSKDEFLKFLREYPKKLEQDRIENGDFIHFFHDFSISADPYNCYVAKIVVHRRDTGLTDKYYICENIEELKESRTERQKELMRLIEKEKEEIEEKRKIIRRYEKEFVSYEEQKAFAVDIDAGVRE